MWTFNDFFVYLQPSTSQEGEEGQLEQNTADMEDDNSKDSDSSFDENKPPKHPTGIF